MGAVYGIVVREFVRFARQRGRALSSIARPFIWLIFAGAGFATVFTGGDELDYRRYMAPGLLGMVVMFGSLLASLSTVTDRDAGVLRMLLVAPIRRSTITLGKALGATGLGTAQALVVGVILLPAVRLWPGGAGLLLALAALAVSSLALGALGRALPGAPPRPGAAGAGVRQSAGVRSRSLEARAARGVDGRGVRRGAARAAGFRRARGVRRGRARCRRAAARAGGGRRAGRLQGAALVRLARPGFSPAVFRAVARRQAASGLQLPAARPVECDAPLQRGDAESRL
ncbi:MAG: hypothetical protein DMD36_03915 [Gemmatimonadetes bacterium]|nr:MAG: hypothetical protein DMD36_03915 [Gemmatimonadota bacterium]